MDSFAGHAKRPAAAAWTDRPAAPRSRTTVRKGSSVPDASYIGQVPDETTDPVRRLVHACAQRMTSTPRGGPVLDLAVPVPALAAARGAVEPVLGCERSGTGHDQAPVQYLAVVLPHARPERAHLRSGEMSRTEPNRTERASGSVLTDDGTPLLPLPLMLQLLIMLLLIMLLLLLTKLGSTS
jgi:hypothetical protein